MDVSLTERQLEVLRLKANRHTNAEIAEQLVISITTVKWHVRQIYNQLGTNTRAEMVAVARQSGLLDKKLRQKKHSTRALPVPLSPFVGREQELNHVRNLLSNPQNRMVTLIGPGGIGKTRLALQAAKSLEDHFAEGLCWVGFSALDKPELVFSTLDEFIAERIITALDLSSQGSQDLVFFLESYLRGREILIILDGFELVSSGAPFISSLITKTTACKFLITSRERLNQPGEVLVHVQGLMQTITTGQKSSTSDAVKLFLQEASRVSDDEIQSVERLPVIQRICARLEGLPLAITLAAEWVRLLPVEEIEHELDRGLEFLDAGSVSLRSVFDRSWNYLPDHQRASFARLAVFQSGFSREAAEQVAGADLFTLSSLFDKSLVQKTDEGRYTLHDLLRQYAAERLDARGEREMVRDAHCAYYASLAANQKVSVYRGDHSQILVDLDNLRAAWRWAVTHRRLEDLHRCWQSIFWFYNLRAKYRESMAALKLILDTFDATHLEGLQGLLYGKALAGYGRNLALLEGTDRGAPFVMQGVEINRRMDGGEDLAWQLILSVYSGMVRNDSQTWEQYCRESLNIFEHLDHKYGIAFAAANLGDYCRIFGRYSEARQHIARAMAVSRSINDKEGIAFAIRNLARLDLHLGDFESARRNFQEEAALWEKLSLPRVRCEALRFMAAAYFAAGNFDHANELLQEGLAEFEQLGDERNALKNLLMLGEFKLHVGQLQEVLELLQDARLILERRQDSVEQARWWQLFGRVSQLQDDPETALLAFCRALGVHSKIDEATLVELLIDFALFYLHQSDLETALRLLGYVQSRPGLPALVMRDRIDPLHIKLAAEMDQETFISLLEEGASLDQQAWIDQLLEECV
ncbi:MAG TPA: tetratricopeptide repeat protein [Anaerolineales bacterium]|jgi:predicted ATPase/DNA-binding CsgD family transcriptional regulator|nr:tetratricopeptide repeat protein [Anaerolineales bacterium]